MSNKTNLVSKQELKIYMFNLIIFNMQILSGLMMSAVVINMKNRIIIDFKYLLILIPILTSIRYISLTNTIRRNIVNKHSNKKLIEGEIINLLGILILMVINILFIYN